MSEQILPRLAEVWARQLGVPAVAATDNFFALGGRSLGAAAMLGTVDAEFGVRISLAEFLAAPTLGHLAGQIAGRIAAGPAHAHAGPAGPGPDLVVQLQNGDAAARPLVLVHPHGGSALSYLPLVEGLPAHVPVVGLMARGIESGAAPHDSIPDMAAEYIDALQRRDLATGMRLGGWSFGAFVAFEMAVRLHRAGAPPAALLLIEPRPALFGPADRPAPPGAGNPPLDRQIRDTWHIEVDESELERRDSAGRYGYLLAAGIAQGRLPEEMTVDMLVRRATVRDRNTTAFLRYRTDARYPATTHVFRVTGEGPAAANAIADHWRDRLTGRVTYHDVPGHHGLLMRDPISAAALAARVHEVLADEPQDTRR